MSESLRGAASAASGHQWPTFAAALLALLYVAGTGMGWATNASDAYFGVSRIDTLPAERNRLVILGVQPGSPADRAGLRTGDVILAVDGEERVPGSRARWAGTGAAPTFQTRPLAVPNGDAPLFRRTTGERKPGEVVSLRIHRPASIANRAAESSQDVTLIADSRLGSRDVVIGLITWHTVALLTLLAGIVVALYRPSDTAARLLLAATSFFASALLLLSWDNRPLPDGIALAASIATSVLLVAGSASLLHLCLAFPSPHRLLLRLGSLGPGVSARFGRATAAIYVAPLALALGLYLGPAYLWPWSYVIVIVLIALALLALVRSILHPPSPIARAQLKWIAAPLVVGLIALALGPGVTASTGALSEVFSATVTVAAWVLFPIGVGIAVLRYRLFDVDLVLRAAVLYPLLIALLAGAYVAAAQSLGQAAISLLGPGASGNLALSALAALLVAAVAHPAYCRLQSGLDGLLYRKRLARQRLLEEAASLLAPSTREDVVSFLTEHAVKRLDLVKAWVVLPCGAAASGGAVASALLLSSEALLSRMSGVAQPVLLLGQEELALGGTALLSAGDPVLEAWHAAGARVLVPLLGSSSMMSGKGLLGIWALGIRESGALLDSEDITTLGRIAGQAALALDNDRLRRQEAAEIERNARYRRFFSPQIADLIASEGGQLATHRRELTVLFVELRGLSAVGEIVEPEELVHHLNDFVDAVTAVIFDHGGTMDKRLGDSLMAFFGDPLPMDDHAPRAARAAVAMQRRLEDLKRSWSAGVASVDMGIGLATGWVTAGTIGSSSRQEYAVVGGAVAEAACLAGTAGRGEVLLAEKTQRLLNGDVAVSPRGDVPMEGRRQPLKAFCVSYQDGASGGAAQARQEPTDRASRLDSSADVPAGADLLARTSLFASLPIEELGRLASRLRLQRYKKGAIILSGHEQSGSFFLIRSGTVKVSRVLVTGDEAVINILGRGEFFGELALLEGQSHSTIVALQPTEVLVLSRDVFLDCLQSYPAAASAAIGLLSERIRRLSDQLEEAYALELPQRLARRLLALGSIHGKKTDEGLVIDLPLTQTELAGMVGASRQRVNRILAEWQDRRLLRLGSFGRMTLLSPDTFTEISPEPLVS